MNLKTFTDNIIRLGKADTTLSGIKTWVSPFVTTPQPIYPMVSIEILPGTIKPYGIGSNKRIYELFIRIVCIELPVNLSSATTGSLFNLLMTFIEGNPKLLNSESAPTCMEFGEGSYGGIINFNLSANEYVKDGAGSAFYLDVPCIIIE